MINVTAYSPQTAVVGGSSHRQELSSMTATHLKKLSCCKVPQTTAFSSHRIKLHCNNSSGPAKPSSGDNESRTILDAFFLGKALAEAINERVESTVGEVFSTLGRLQAEQQRQLQDFQEEVMERAQRATEKASREAMEAQGLVTNYITEEPASEAIDAQEIVTKSAAGLPPSATDGTKKSENISEPSSTIIAGSTTKPSSSSNPYKDVNVTDSDSDEELVRRVSRDE